MRKIAKRIIPLVAVVAAVTLIIVVVAVQRDHKEYENWALGDFNSTFYSVTGGDAAFSASSSDVGFHLSSPDIGPYCGTLGSDNGFTELMTMYLMDTGSKPQKHIPFVIYILPSGTEINKKLFPGTLNYKGQTLLFTLNNKVYELLSPDAFTNLFDSLYGNLQWQGLFPQYFPSDHG